MHSLVVTAVGTCAARGAGLPALLLEHLTSRLRAAGVSVLRFDAAVPASDGDALGDHLRAYRREHLSERIERAAARHDVVLIDAGDCDGHAWRPALIAARLALVPLSGADADFDRNDKLATCLNTARMFNPGLRVLIVPAATNGLDTIHMWDVAAVRAYAAEVMTARVLPGSMDAALSAAPRRAHGGAARNDTDTALAALVEEIFGNLPRASLRSRAALLRRLALL